MSPEYKSSELRGGAPRVVALLIALLFTCHSVDATRTTPAFAPTSVACNRNSRGTVRRPVNLFSSPLGDFFSGLTGAPPKSLNPPVGLLSGTSIDPNSPNVDLQRVYKASIDGWSAVDFHRACDGRGSALVVALSKSGKRFGGFNPLGWMSTDDYGSSNAAFLWFEKGDSVVKCPILSGGNAAIFDYAMGGPNFGATDLIIGAPRAAVMGGFAGPDMEDTSINAGDLRECSSTVGGAYDFVSGWPVRGDFKAVEVEVYCNGNVKPASSGGGFKLWPF